MEGAGAEMTRDQKVEAIARVCHAANTAWNDAHGEVTLPWDEMRESICQGVQGILDGNTPEQSHEDWLSYKIEHGWKFGPVKDADAKTHPLMIAYDRLPEHQKVKDALFSTIVLTLGPVLRFA